MKKNLQSKKTKGMVTFCVSVTMVASNLYTIPVYASVQNSNQTLIQSKNSAYKTNLQWNVGGQWSETENGLNCNSAGDSFIYSNTNVKDFVYSANVNFNEIRGAASLVIRSDKNEDNKNAYVLNVNVDSKKARVFKFENNRAIDLAEEKTINLKPGYNLKAIAVDKHIVFYVDDQLIASTADYTMGKTDLGQNDAILEGSLGLLTYNSNVTYQDVYYHEINGSNTPVLNDIGASVTNGQLEAKFNFNKNQYVYTNYVSNDCNSINLIPSTNSKEIKTTILDSNGNVMNGSLKLDIGKNIYTIVSENNEGAKVIYSIVIYRRQANYYDEQYRGQYHYSVKEGWANDPNGMVYFNNEYHLFYQFYDDGTNWGPMHWGHTVSKDLIHWEDQPIAFYPDEYGAMFSGCAVVDENNTSGLFKDGKSGLVALITADGNGQRIIAAYSEDGYNWQKRDGVLVDWTEDSLNNKDFRDPKVFRYKDKWFMVIAGGPLRIYSSDNLLDWKQESNYKDLHTECPDLYRLPLKNNDGSVEYKWVLSRGGRYYKIGDFTDKNGKWEFVADKDYEGNDTSNDGVMNFGKDSYAAMTYYKNDFNYEDRNGKVDDVVEINWMNTWEDYCNAVDDASGNNVFNGTFNLQLKLGLTRDENGKIVLTQTPISEYDTLKNDKNTISLKDASIKPGENLLKDFKGKSYKIESRFMPQEGTKEVGFNVQVGANGEKTEVKYNFETKEVSIDRSKSGIIPTKVFGQVMKKSVKENSDGSVDLTIYVDRSSVEVFSKDYTVAGAAQIFASEISDGLEVFSIGGESKANIDISEMKSIWNVKANTDKAIKLSSTDINVYSGNDYEIFYNVVGTDNKKITVESEDPSIATATESDGKIIVKGLSKGETTLKIKLNEDESVFRTCKVKIGEDKFVTNLSGWNASSGTWEINSEFYECNSNDNAFTFAGNKAENDKFTYEVDVKRNNGLINIVFGAKSLNAFEGCYAVQLANDRVRVFDFNQDHTFNSVNYDGNNKDIEKVKIDVDGNHIKVFVDGIQYIEVKADRDYFKGYFGLGLYNSFAQFSNIKVTGAYIFNNITTQIKDLTFDEKATLEEISSKLPVEVEVSDVNGNSIKNKVTWDCSTVKEGVSGEYLATGTLENGLKLDAKVIISKAKDVPNKTKLEELISKSQSLKEKSYTESSWNELQKQLAKAKEVFGNENATEGEIKEIAELLETSINSLVKNNSEESNNPGANPGGDQVKNQGGNESNNVSDENVPKTGIDSIFSIALLGLVSSVAGIFMFKRKNKSTAK